MLAARLTLLLKSSDGLEPNGARQQFLARAESCIFGLQVSDVRG
jgi:hypothetical protein